MQKLLFIDQAGADDRKEERSASTASTAEKGLRKT